jgi:hypothetical protein
MQKIVSLWGSHNPTQGPQPRINRARSASPS